MTTKITSVESDPIYAAIEQHRKLVAESDRLYDELQKAENAAEKKQRQRRLVTCHRGVPRIADT